MVDDKLFRLIKSLSASEKRYFVIYSKKQLPNNHQIELFKAIDGLNDFSKRSLLQQLKSKSIKTNLSVFKNQLFNSIVEVLKNFNEFNSQREKLKTIIEHIEYIESKGLYDICIKYIDKAIDIAEYLEEYVTVLELYSKKHKMLWSMDGNIDKEIDLLNIETEKAEKLLKNILHYNKLYREFYYHFVKSDNINNDHLNNIISSKWMENEDQAITFSSKHKFYQMHSMMASKEGKHQDFYTLQKKILDNFEKQHDQNLNSFPLKYSSLIYNYLIASIHSKNYDLVEKKLHQLRILAESKLSKEQMLRILGYYYFVSLFYYYSISEFEKADQVINDMKSIDILESPVVTEQNRESFYNLFFRIKFDQGKYEEAKKVLRYFNNKSKFTITHFKSMNKVWNVMVNFELKEFIYLDSLISTVQKFLMNKPESHQIEIKILSCIKKYIKNPDGNHLRLFQNLYSELNQIKVSSSSENIKFEYFDFFKWIKNKEKVLKKLPII